MPEGVLEVVSVLQLIINAGALLGGAARSQRPRVDPEPLGKFRET